MFAHRHGSQRSGLLAWDVLCAGLMAVVLVGSVGCNQSPEPSKDAGTSTTKKEGEAVANGPELIAPGESATSAPANAQAAAVPQGPAQPANQESSNNARAILEEMVKAYREAKTYIDNGRLLVTGQNPRAPSKEEGALASENFFAVSFSRPNKIRLQAYMGTVVVDGQKLWAFVDMLPGQVLSVPAPEKLAIESIYSDVQLVNALAMGLSQFYSIVPPQLILLLADDPLKTLLHDVKSLEVLPPAKIGTQGPMYDRVRATRPDGTLVFWIDPQSRLLRRLEYPTRQLNEDIGQGQLKGFSVTADFADAQAGPIIDPQAFKFSMPENVEPVDMLLPLELTLIGKPAPKFKFMQGTAEVTPASLAGKATVMEFWSTSCQPCRRGLGALEQVRQKYKDNPKVAFLAVSLDDPSKSDAEVQGLLDQWKVGLPMARDANMEAGRLLSVAYTPTTIVLDASGKVQGYETGVDEQAETRLSERLDKILAGEDVFAAALERGRENLKAATERFRQWFQGRAKEGSFWPQSEEQQIPMAEIAPKSQPTSLRLKPLWSCQQGLQEPGNLLVIDDPAGKPRILVLDDSQSVVELSLQGKVGKSYPLRRREEEPVRFLRTAIDKDGVRWFAAAGSGPSQQQIHLYKNDDFQYVLSYPDDAVQHPHQGLADVQFGDLAGDGNLAMYASYWGVVGVQGVSLSGERLWSNKSLANVVRVSVVRPGMGSQANLICTNELGVLVLLDDKGQVQRRLTVPNRPIHWVVADDLNGDGQTELCGLSP
jgi:thiol-disulfide isomerase/thioredoxin/outer membrane lipoprotein-sorting protein